MLSHMCFLAYHNRVATVLAVWSPLDEFNLKGASCGRRNKNLSSINAFDLAGDSYATCSINNAVYVLFSCDALVFS